MPKISNTTDTIIAKQAAAETAFNRARSSFKKVSLRNAIALGGQILRLRKNARISRRLAANALGVSTNAIYVIENPEKRPETASPKNALRYLDAVETLCSGMQAAAAQVKFERSTRGRPRMATAT